MTVRDLNQNQLDELKNNYFYSHLDNDNSSQCDGYDFSYDIPNEVIYQEYDGIEFTEDDFFCSKNNDNIIEDLANKWYEDCLRYNIPISPSDVKDIIEDLIKTKKSKEKLY